jgi:hypothetical protein
MRDRSVLPRDPNLNTEIFINATAHEKRIAIKENEILAELLVENPEQERLVGAIFKGTVTTVLPGMQAAFVDIGQEKAAFLHASDIGVAEGEGSEEEAEEIDDEESDEPVITRKPTAPPFRKSSSAARSGGADREGTDRHQARASPRSYPWRVAMWCSCPRARHARVQAHHLMGRSAGSCPWPRRAKPKAMAHHHRGGERRRGRLQGGHPAAGGDVGEGGQDAPSPA